jgi:hypothetical protein
MKISGHKRLQIRGFFTILHRNAYNKILAGILFGKQLHVGSRRREDNINTEFTEGG